MTRRLRLVYLVRDSVYKDYMIKLGRKYFLSKDSVYTGVITKTTNKYLALKRQSLKDIRNIAKIFGIKLKKRRRWVF